MCIGGIDNLLKSVFENVSCFLLGNGYKSRPMAVNKKNYSGHAKAIKNFEFKYFDEMSRMSRNRNRWVEKSA